MLLNIKATCTENSLYNYHNSITVSIQNYYNSKLSLKNIGFPVQTWLNNVILNKPIQNITV